MKENRMWCRGLAAALVLLMLGGLVVAETYQGLIVELSDSKLTILVRKTGQRKSEKKVLDMADKITVSQPRAKDEAKLSSPELQKRIERAKQSVGTRGVLATINTNDRGQVITIKLAASRVPEKAAAILEKADQIELYSLEPEPDDKAAKGPKATFFRGWLILGKTVLKTATSRKQVLDALDESVGRGRMAKCFDPRHGIRASHAGQTVELVICFRCGQAYFYLDPRKDDHSTLSINRGTQPMLDAMLKAAHIPLARPSKE
jgi:hypothetical protein